MTCTRSCPGGYGVSLCFAPGGRYLVLGTREGRVQLLDAASGDLALDEDPHGGKPVYGLALRPDGKGFATGAADKTVKFWEFQARDL